MSSFKRINVDEAKILIETPDANIVDIRDANAYEQGHIHNAANINDETIDIFLKEANKAKPLICYCYHGISSQNAASFFISKGFSDVYSIDGGYTAWSEKYVR